MRDTSIVHPRMVDTFRILNERAEAYHDLTGSGIETVAHIQENKRIVIMFCAFDGPPKIQAGFCTAHAEVVYPSHRDFPSPRSLFPEYPGVRDIIRVTVNRIGDSCGYSTVPVHGLCTGERDALDKWAEKKGLTG